MNVLRRLSKGDKGLLESRNHLGQTLLHIIFERPFRFSIYFHRIVDFLLSSGVDPNALNAKQETPLVTAAKNHQRQCITYAFDWNGKISFYCQNKPKPAEEARFKPFDFNCQDPVSGFSIMHFIALDPSLILIADLIRAGLINPLLLDNRHKLPLAYLPKMYLSSKKFLLGYSTSCLVAHLNGTFKPPQRCRAHKDRSLSESWMDESSRVHPIQPPSVSLMASKEKKFMNFINSRFSKNGTAKHSEHLSSTPSLHLEYRSVKINSSNKLRTLKSFAHDQQDNDNFIDEDFRSIDIKNGRSAKKHTTKLRLFADFTKRSSYQINFNSNWLSPFRELNKEASIVSIGQEVGKRLDSLITGVGCLHCRS